VAALKKGAETVWVSVAVLVSAGCCGLDEKDDTKL
jgi:hypothetical protein